MKAAVVEEPLRLVVREIPDPQVGPYDCLCRLLWGATCTGTDQHIIVGRFPFGIDYPTILGHESVGRAIEVGPKVRHFKVGDLLTRVGAPAAADGSMRANWGGFAELGVARDHRAMREDGLPQEEWFAHRVNQVLPGGIDPRAATMIITWRETLSFITRMGIAAGSAVLVIGSGGNGLSFVSHARNLGAGSVAMIGSAGRADLARGAGAAHSFDYKSDDLKEQIAAAYPDGVDYLIDAVGKVGQVDRVLSLLKPGGTFCVYGVDHLKQYGINPWTAGGSFSVYHGGYDEAEVHDQVVDLVRRGKLKADLWLDMAHPFPLDEIGRAFEAVLSRRMVKALVRLSDEDA